MEQCTEVVVIGAGPSGALAAKLLRQRGHQVVVLERTHFPRFSIGESLLPQSMEFLQQADMLDELDSASFQVKVGANFLKDGMQESFDFREKFSAGPGTTYQVQRAKFDHLLANNAQSAGAEIRYGHNVMRVINNTSEISLQVEDEHKSAYFLKAQYVLDASGFGRVLPRLLDLELPSTFPSRVALFTHIKDGIPEGAFNREMIQIVVLPANPSVWFWLIPFENGRCSLGVVARKEELAHFQGGDDEILKTLVSQSGEFSDLLSGAEFDTPVSKLEGFSCNVKSLWGERFALLGNAGEFLDPVFSSGITIALKSAHLAAPLVSRQILGKKVDWQAEYADPLSKGVDVFRVYVQAWYDLRFQRVIFAPNKDPRGKSMVCSILAGYAWDESNPFVQHAARRFSALHSIC